MKPIRALYHAYEAKIMADDAPNVNHHLDILVANADASWSFTTHFTAEELAGLKEIPVDSLREMFEKYGPRATDELDAKDVKLIKRSESK
jgi:hypothetical protein